MKYIYINLFSLLICWSVSAQQYITWNLTNAGNQITGTYMDGGVVQTVTVTAGNPGDFSFNSPANQQNNLVVIGAQTFSTSNIIPTGYGIPISNLIFNFDTPVIITRFNTQDVDQNAWDDSFNFNFAMGVGFTNNPPPTGNGCAVNLNGVTATQGNGGFASWHCLDNPITNFTISNSFINNRSTAYLGYSMEVLVPPSQDTICFGDTAPNLPTTIGNGVTGTWNPLTINTTSLGTTIHTFTPNAGQAIQCPINMPVTVIDCCTPTLTSSQNVNTQLQRERSNWIRSTDNITFSDGIQGNGVVYHAGNFLELNPGFEAVFDSQFSAYIEDCSGNFVYRQSSTESNINKDLTKYKNVERRIKNPKYFDIISEPKGNEIKIPLTDYDLKQIEIYSIEGKLLYSGIFEKVKTTVIDIANFNSGVYIVKAISDYGNVYTQKFIKK